MHIPGMLHSVCTQTQMQCVYLFRVCYIPYMYKHTILVMLRYTIYHRSVHYKTHAMRSLHMPSKHTIRSYVSITLRHI